MNSLSSPAIEARGLVKSFGNTKVLRGLNFRVGKGVTLAIFGPNGAGKTTLIKTLASVMRPTSGQVFIDGLDLKEHAQEARGHLGLVSHQSYLYGALSAEENLVFYGRMYGVAEPRERTREILSLVGLTARRHDRAATFSRGMLQRLSLGRALIHKPSILMLDEPETGLDPQALASMWDILRHDAPSRTIIFTSHNFERALAVANEAIVLGRGKIAWSAQGDVLTLTSLSEAYVHTTGEHP
ncbi:MAG: ABC transporter ATP-binding protein [Dehalococcoidia bacterium]|nr:ABC transporter ATP-binding protein [Dehalococcoidia bacterium]